MTHTTPISDVTTTKRSSTMDEEKLMKNPKIDEKEGKEEEADCESSDTSSGEWVCTGYEILKVKRKPEPQWDVDSFDGREYESDPDDRNYFSDDKEYEEHRALKRMFFESKGFVCEPFSGNCPLTEEDFQGKAYDNEGKPYENKTVRQAKEELANVCIEKYNKDKEKTVELVKIVRVYITGGSQRKNYITFMAREYPNGPLVEYQAKVIMNLSGEPPFPILCRPSPVLTLHFEGLC